MKSKSNSLKYLIRKYRSAQKHKLETPLIHLIINIRSIAFSSENKRIKAITMQRQLSRQGQIKSEIIREYEGNCFHCHFSRPHYGHKTYLKDGVFSVFDTGLDLPF